MDGHHHHHRHMHKRFFSASRRATAPRALFENEILAPHALIEEKVTPVREARAAKTSCTSSQESDTCQLPSDGGTNNLAIILGVVYVLLHLWLPVLRLTFSSQHSHHSMYNCLHLPAPPVSCTPTKRRQCRKTQIARLWRGGWCEEAKERRQACTRNGSIGLRKVSKARQRDVDGHGHVQPVHPTCCSEGFA